MVLMTQNYFCGVCGFCGFISNKEIYPHRFSTGPEILFEEYPDMQKAYGLCHSLRMIFSKNTIKDAARLSMAKWYNKVEEAGFHSFNVIAATFYEHYDEILNFYNNRSSNAMAESFNAKVKLFRANLRGVADKKFFLFRIAKLYAYPH